MGSSIACFLRHCISPPALRRVLVVGFCAAATACALPVKWGGEAIQGTALAEGTGAPVEGALVIAYYSSVYVGGQARYTQGYAITDEDGRFRIPADPKLAYAQVGQRPGLLFAHPDFKIIGIFFQDGGPYEVHPRLPPRDDRAFLESAKRECDHLPSDACLKLLDFATGR